LVGEWLYPPGSPAGIKNDLLPGARADYPPFDSVNLIGTALCRGRDSEEFYGGSGNTVPRTTATQQNDAEEEEKSLFSGKTV